MTKPPAYVSMARFDWWQVKRSGALAPNLSRLGFRGGLFPRGERNARFSPPLDFDGMAGIARELIALGLPFGAGREWSPIEVVLDLRDRGLVQGPVTEIFWRGPGGWDTRIV